MVLSTVERGSFHPMPDTFGARLRDRREREQIPLQTIAEQTKIKASLLEALERDDVSHWPGGIFRRAFVRAYAQAIGLDPDTVVREFVELFPDPAEIVATESNADDVPVGRAARFRAALGATIRTLSRGERVVEAPTAVRRPMPVPSVVAQRAVAIDLLPEQSARQDPEPQSPAPQDPLPEDSAVVAPAAAEAVAESAPYLPAVDLTALARLCTSLSQVADPDALTPLLADAASVLDAAGLVVWIWDFDAAVLRAALAHGYSDRVIAQLPAVEKDADNATAAAFRLGQTCSVAASGDAHSALAVPLMTAAGCSGVLAIEIDRGRERHDEVRAAAAVIAAQLSAMIQAPSVAQADRKLA